MALPECPRCTGVMFKKRIFWQYRPQRSDRYWCPLCKTHSGKKGQTRPHRRNY